MSLPRNIPDPEPRFKVDEGIYYLNPRQAYKELDYRRRLCRTYEETIHRLIRQLREVEARRG